MSKSPYYLRSVIDIGTLPNHGVTNNSTLKVLSDDGIIELNAKEWRLTERGRKYLELLGEVPLPVQKWVDPRQSGGAQ